MPSPYVQDLFAALATDPRLELRVWYLEQEAHDTYWGVQSLPDYARVLPGHWIWFFGARVHYNPSIWREIGEDNSDLVVVVGYVGLTNQVAMRKLHRMGKQWVFWGEVPGLVSRSRLGRTLRKVAQSPLRHCSGIAGVGSHAVKAYRSILGSQGAPEIPVANIPYHCRIEPFKRAASARRRSSRLRFLYCGQLIERKGVDLLCEAFLKLIREGHDAKLTMVGEGELRAKLEALFARSHKNHVSFLGFRPVEYLPEIFADSDVFVLPSRHDGWGVVVNQAIGSGMPVIATDAVGAANDLILDGENGFRVAANSSDAIYHAMLRCVREDDLHPMGRRSMEISETITLKQAADDWCDFYEVVGEQRAGKQEQGATGT